MAGQKAVRLRDATVLIAVTSAPHNHVQRETIRRTWMRRAAGIAPEWTVVFVVGRPGQPTAREGDKLYLDFEEAYEYLPRKTLMTIRWFLENERFDYLFKTDDDCYLNVWELARFVPGDSAYFGQILGQRGHHRRDYHFGKTTAAPVLDKSEHGGPWAAGFGYGVSRAAARLVAENLSDRDAGQLIFEDKMIGDALRDADLPNHLSPGWGAQSLKAFMRYEHDPDGYVLRPRLTLPLRPLIPKWKVYHLGSAGGSPPPYRVNADTIGAMARALDRSLGWRVLAKRITGSLRRR
jgi:hypothetical protein